MFATLLVVLVACGGSDAQSSGPEGEFPSSTSSTGSPSSTTATTVEVDEDPPPIDVGFDVRPVVHAAALPDPPAVRIGNSSVLLELTPWTTCWTNYCADGAPPEKLEVIDGESELFVEFPVEGWAFSATTRSAKGQCGRTQTQELDSIAPTIFSLPAQGEPGDYVVDVFGRGDGGDVIVTFGWSTDEVGVFAQPSASLSLLADHDGEVDSYGVEFQVLNLAEDPDNFSAEVTVTAENGKGHRIELDIDEGISCSQGAGSLFLRAPESEGLIAAGLGEGPFTYDVLVVIDGAEYRSTANWPADEDDECRPCVPLTFDPPLPGLGAGE